MWHHLLLQLTFTVVLVNFNLVKNCWVYKIIFSSIFKTVTVTTVFTLTLLQPTYENAGDLIVFPLLYFSAIFKGIRKQVILEICTGENCVLGTGENCVLGTGENCVQGTGENCVLGTGENCVLGTGENCVQGTGGNCVLGTGENCVLGTGGNCFLLSK